MSDFTQFLDDIRAWISRPDLDDEVVTTFVRMAETTLSPQLKVREAMVRSRAIITEGAVSLPVDYNMMDYCRVVGGRTLKFKVKEDFLDMSETKGHYTIVGTELIVGGAISESEGKEIEICYYKQVPPFVDESTWLHTHYYNIFLQAACAAGALYSEEIEKATALTQMVAGLVESANRLTVLSSISGSVLVKRPPMRIG